MQTFNECKALNKALQSEKSCSRNPLAPIASIVQLDSPMEAIADMLVRMRRDRPGTGGVGEAIWGRDLVLIKLLVSTALRQRNLSLLTWRPDNTGMLYQRPDGTWWVRIEKKLFKNVVGAAGRNDYDVPVLEMAHGDISRYLKVYRPRLMQHPTDLVFLAAPRTDRTSHRPWTDLSKRVAELTRRYLWRCPGVGPHSFRHIVATSVLKGTNNDYKSAALILNDKVSTVEKAYAHVTSGDATRKMEVALKGVFSRM
jgi:integrase